MALTDFHVHSDVSQDSSASMADMARAEAAAGVSLLCFTNHCDMVNWRTYTLREDCREAVPRTFARLAEYRALPDRPDIEVRAGIELGEPLFAPDIAREIAASPGLDFVMGSLHILRGHGDLWLIDYGSEARCEKIYTDYLDELIEIAQLGCFDVMAHIGYARRNMMKQGFSAQMSLALYGDRIKRLLALLIDNGRGIEINCSGIRDGSGPFPQPEILRLYRALGGDIVTIGSDAHRPEDAAKCLDQGYEVLRACGFRYITAYKNRKPEFIKI